MRLTLADSGVSPVLPAFESMEVRDFGMRMGCSGSGLGFRNFTIAAFRKKGKVIFGRKLP